ncbi:ImmA/IrrE family metallo-endopeptidase [Bradyrhizobium sp. B097]|uniref:ImmA/IrrE family metallo-endopeptidase n=1 Tax=Bradyrhizobium sp. B097 TaxID=3140244 RepID=UPI0031834F83
MTKIARVADGYGRTYDQAEEHDAFYLASATLLPRAAILDAVSRRMTSADIGLTFGTSSELADYRIKRLGLWREHIGKRVGLCSD